MPYSFHLLPSGARKKYTAKYTAAFIIDWISSGVPTLIGLFTALIILLILLKTCLACLKSSSDQNNKSSSGSGLTRKLLRSKSIRRFLVIDCNCPWYRTRPRLRFQIRFLLLIIFFILRITAIGLYATAPSGDNDGGSLAVVCAFSLIFIFNTLCLDFYRYWVWWHYTPQRDTRCHLKPNKHERFIPYHMMGFFHNSETMGNRPCTDTLCRKKTLDHIAVFHSTDYQPQPRWRDIPKPPLAGPPKSKIPCIKSKEIDNQPHYIGFHTTDPDAAVSIAHSDFRTGTCGWIGAGAYFARSVSATWGKAKSDGGAHIIAEIRMGKVYEVERNVITKGHPRFDKDIYDYAHHSKWHADYDTCYMIQNEEMKDEFAIKDPESQIVKWVIVIEPGFDSKVEKYGLLTEFEQTRCRCI